jgi:Flp pilus assembly protein TadG
MSRPSPEISRRPRGRQGERGSASIELVILLPALFAVMLLGMQAALYHHAQTVAIAAAQEGARATGGEHGSESDGVETAAAFVEDAGGDDVLPGATTNATRSATTATVVVRGHSLSVIPGWSPEVRQVASVPVERLTAP